MLVIILLSSFFIYLLMLSGSISTILPCSVQKFMKNNIFFKHIMIFCTIFFLTFILDWYNPDAVFEYIYDEHMIYLFFKESIIIYIAFLISSCLEKNVIVSL